MFPLHLNISVRHDGERAQEGPKASTSEGHIKAPIHTAHVFSLN